MTGIIKTEGGYAALVNGTLVHASDTEMNAAVKLVSLGYTQDRVYVPAAGGRIASFWRRAR